MSLRLPKTATMVLTELTGEPRPELALLLVLRDAVAYRLEKVTAALKAFEDKYGMSFEEYRERWEAEDKPEYYTYEAERDFLEWEALVTRRKRLEDLQAWLW